MLDDGVGSGTEDHGGFVKTQTDDAHEGGEHADDLDGDESSDRYLPRHVERRLPIFDGSHGEGGGREKT